MLRDLHPEVGVVEPSAAQRALLDAFEQAGQRRRRSIFIQAAAPTWRSRKRRMRRGRRLNFGCCCRSLTFPSTSAFFLKKTFLH